MIQKAEIILSKTKLLMMLIGSTIFVGLGIWFVMNPAEIKPDGETFVSIIGIASILFFGACLLFITKKLFDTKIGMVIDENGINDNSSGVSVGLINWEDISGISTTEIASTKFILLETTNPDKYINRAKNGLSKRAMKENNRMYGTPLTISSNTLKIKHNALLEIVHRGYQQMNKSKTTP